MKRIKIISILVIINILISIMLNIFAYKVKAVNQTKSNDINSIDTSKYPGIKEKIESLKSEHPNWNFTILYTGIDWNEAIAYEYTGHGKSPKNLVPDKTNYAGEWICAYCGDTAYDSGSWKCASESALKYMMDPRASLNSSDIFQFLELSYNYESGYSWDTVKQMLSGSFLDNDTYINRIMESCKNYNVNPYYITARILQEQGKSGTVLTSGQGYNGEYVGVYNVFNIGASGSTKEKVILNGLAKASSYGWDTMEKALDGGIKIISNSYISVGQNTMYFQKFDVENSDGKMYWHQYMQNILAAQSEGTTLRKTLNNINAIDYQYTFIIPVYENMPSNTCSRPSTTSPSKAVQSDLVWCNANPNIKIKDSPDGNKIGSLFYGEVALRLERATNKVNGTYWDKVMNNDGVIGYVARTKFDYESDYKEYLVSIGGNGLSNDDNGGNNNNGGNNSGDNNSGDNGNSGNNSGNNGNAGDNGENVVKGDVNGDGKITASDYVLIKNQIMGTISLDEKSKKAADVNGDGKISASDYVMVKNYIMGTITEF